MINLATVIIDSDPLPKVDTAKSLPNLLTIVFTLLGAVAFLMVVIAGFRYLTAGADANKAAEAKRQIAHALIGLVIAASAATIINFVLEKA
jgi:cytochrome bd-type quinol oxidase subunit 2